MGSSRSSSSFGLNSVPMLMSFSGFAVGTASAGSSMQLTELDRAAVEAEVGVRTWLDAGCAGRCGAGQTGRPIR